MNTYDLTDTRERRAMALEAAIEFIKSGRMVTDIGIRTVTDTAQEFYAFLTGPDAPPTSGTPSEPSSSADSTPAKPTKTTVPAPPDNPVDF